MKPLLKRGFTTGSCAAAAAKAAIGMLFTGQTIPEVSITTPNGTTLCLEVEDVVCTPVEVSCAVRKDAGDDPDVTNGVLVYACVRKTPEGIRIDGGAGVGRVTRRGLQQEIGEAAINKVPKAMIQREAEILIKEFRYMGGISILISIPEGAALAKKTFNPRLGIQGGISVLGTTGIVEPMSEKALTDTIYLELQFLKENGRKYCYVVPGNYGNAFLSEQLKFCPEDAVKCSNYIGETIMFAGSIGMKGILLIGHIGKFVKLAAGIMNTHSGMADGRMEILGVHAALSGADKTVVKAIMECVTTSEALHILEEEHLLEMVMAGIMDKIETHLVRKAGETLAIGAVMFSETYGVLGKTRQAEDLMRKCQQDRNG